MNRKQFIRNAMFGLAALFLPKISIPEAGSISFVPLPLIPANIKSSLSAAIKLQHAISKSQPPGVYIDLKPIKNIHEYAKIYNRLKKRMKQIKNYGMD